MRGAVTWRHDRERGDLDEDLVVRLARTRWAFRQRCILEGVIRRIAHEPTPAAVRRCDFIAGSNALHDVAKATARRPIDERLERVRVVEVPRIDMAGDGAANDAQAPPR